MLDHLSGSREYEGQQGALPTSCPESQSPEGTGSDHQTKRAGSNLPNCGQGSELLLLQHPLLVDMQSHGEGHKGVGETFVQAVELSLAHQLISQSCSVSPKLHSHLHIKLVCCFLLDDQHQFLQGVGALLIIVVHPVKQVVDGPEGFNDLHDQLQRHGGS